MDYPYSRIVLIPAADKAAANAAASEIAGSAQGESFIVPLSLNGQGSPTHWIAEWRLTEGCLDALNEKAADFPNAVIADGDTATQAAVIAAAGLQRLEDW